MIATSGIRRSLTVPVRQWNPAVVPTALVFIPILLLYVYFITGGDWTFSKAQGSFYDDLGEAFASRQLSLKREPLPGLLALENPYDPRLNEQFRYHDASLYQGKYYLYWGPFPGIIHAAWLLATGSMINQAMVQFVAMVLICAIVWTLLYQTRQRYCWGALSSVESRNWPHATVPVVADP